MKNILPALFAVLLFPCFSFARNQVATEHYVVVFDDGNEQFANEVITAAEEVWGNLAAAYDILDSYQKIHIFINDPGDIANGYTFAAKNSVTVYTTSLNAGIRGTSNWARNVVTHELAHVFSIKAATKKMLFDNVSFGTWSRFKRWDWAASVQYTNLLAPAWWVEGMAQYEAYKNRTDFWDTHRDMFLRMAVLEGKLLNYVEMGDFGNRNGFYDEMVYNQGYSLVLYMDSVFGAKSVRAAAAAKSYFNFNASLEKSTGRGGEALYGEWSRRLTEKYLRTAGAAGALREGPLLFDGGFWDEFPAVSPDGDRCAFVSNKGYDVGFTHLFLMDMHSGTARRLLDEDKTVDSRVQWFPDGKRLLYARWSAHAAYLDLYAYDIGAGTEKPLTWHARALDPAVSRDGARIAYVENRSGVQNLVVIDADGRNRRQLTNFSWGTDLYSPCWTYGDSGIVLGIFSGQDRDIAFVNASAAPLDRKRKLTDTLFFPDTLSFQEDLGFRLLVHSAADERDPCLSPDGKTLYFSSDRSGIFNIYRMDLSSGRTEQVTNVLGGAFQPSVNFNNRTIVYTGFHAANYSLYTIPTQGFREVPLDSVPRDYGKRGRKPFLFSAGGDDGTSRTKPYQYKLSPYQPVYTMWDVSPFVSFSPAYITDSVGDVQLRGGMNFLVGELSGQMNLGGYLFAGKSLKSRAGLSWGGGLASNIMLPKLMGQSRYFQPSLIAFGDREQVRSNDELKPDPINASRIPDDAQYFLKSHLSDPDTLIARYFDFSSGSFRSTQTFDDAGIAAGLQLDRHTRVDADFSLRSISFSANLLDARFISRARALVLPHQASMSGAVDITNALLMSNESSRILDSLFSQTGETDRFSSLDYFKDYKVYHDYTAGLTYSYENVRPAQIVPTRVDLLNVRFGISSSMFDVGLVGVANDTSYSSRTDPEASYFYGRTADGLPTALYQPLLLRENYSRIEIGGVERFPILGSRKHFATINAFFGSLDRKLPDEGSTFPLEYRSSMFLSAYPFSFDPVDTATVTDSFPARRVGGQDTSVVFVTARPRLADKTHKDILWGNRIMYLHCAYTLELARGLTFRPLGLLLQGVYATLFAEAAAVWNSDLLDFSLIKFLGMNERGDLETIGKSYLKDAGLRIEIPFLLFQNWHGLFLFSWARRMSLDEAILSVNQYGNTMFVRHLDKNRFAFTLSLWN